ncbi:hypothetical protein EMIHUDRAFT_456187 [Emiliania huxleyi CCMP1516]|uniref:26S proteasome regulatory subunit 7-like OB domain-containing protein n=2 Tax=Emiliania huxleyi TaxID=2903 RepID=A0A0D3K7Z4_EMIH1|nr:hypothetical protein EMIHUDRAFT_456187 [Emiliania huxleyi CCMP1516]EOD31879.1 hypothetical protein EMIHUDRAFT_456187 [Emiliania huxleyi CCMP1516]|eukprot:XP_005784308.1 hypothetical protein EMIHUDRAFT_456187 [Emiliania huxleyi CCMP1516]
MPACQSEPVCCDSAVKFSFWLWRAALARDILQQAPMPAPDDDPDEEEDKKEIKALDEGDIALLKTYGVGPYNKKVLGVEKDIKELNTKIFELVGVKESDTGLAPPSQYMINVKQIAKFVVGLGDRVAPADIEEGMRVGVDRNKYQIQIPLPPKIDPTVCGAGGGQRLLSWAL